MLNRRQERQRSPEDAATQRAERIREGPIDIESQSSVLLRIVVRDVMLNRVRAFQEKENGHLELNN